MGGRGRGVMPTAPAPIAPIYMYPSAPTFHNPALMPIATPTPVRSSGEARTSTFAIDCGLPIAPFSIAAYATSGFTPESAINPAPASKPRRMPISGRAPDRASCPRPGTVMNSGRFFVSVIPPSRASTDQWLKHPLHHLLPLQSHPRETER